MFRACLLSIPFLLLFISGVSAVPIYELRNFVCSTAQNCTESSKSGIRTPGLTVRNEVLDGDPDFFPGEFNFYGRSISEIRPTRLKLFTELSLSEYTPGSFPISSTGNDLDDDGAYSGISISERFTVTGRSGEAYFRPVFNITGNFLRPGLGMSNFVGVCAGVDGRPGVSWCGDITGFFAPVSGGIHWIDETFRLPANETSKINLNEVFDYRFFFYNWIFVNEDEATLDNDGHYTVASRADFLNTLTIQTIEVTDIDGNLIPGVQIISESGINYTDVPEPSTGLLVPTALAVLFLAARRRSSTASTRELSERRTKW